MRDIDFLPEWYKERKRHQSHVRRQYFFLAATFVAMMGYNLASMHKMARASGELERLEGRRVEAENVFREFNTVTKDLNQVRVKADLIARIDSKIDIAAVLAEMSHIISETVVLSRVEFMAESFDRDDQDEAARGSGVRIAEDRDGAANGNLSGPVRFRILLGGVAATPADVAALVCRLGDSSYFRDVHASFWRNGKVLTSGRAAPGLSGASGDAVSAEPASGLDVTEFEIVCYLANYEETEKR
jgi:hypothetical protein